MMIAFMAPSVSSYAQHLRWKRPDVPQRHRTEPARDLTVPRLDGHLNVQDRRLREDHAAEFDWRTVIEILGGIRDFADRNVGWFHESSLNHWNCGTRLYDVICRADQLHSVQEIE